MSIIYSKNILKELKNCGYNTTRLRKEKLLSEGTIQKLRNNELVSWRNIDRICKMLDCEPGNILKRVN